MLAAIIIITTTTTPTPFILIINFPHSPHYFTCFTCLCLCWCYSLFLELFYLPNCYGGSTVLGPNPTYFLLSYVNKVYWNTDLSICLHIICGCFPGIKAEFGSSDRDPWPTKPYLYYLFTIYYLVQNSSILALLRFGVG